MLGLDIKTPLQIQSASVLRNKRDFFERNRNCFLLFCLSGCVLFGFNCIILCIFPFHTVGKSEVFWTYFPDSRPQKLSGPQKLPVWNNVDDFPGITVCFSTVCHVPPPCEPSSAFPSIHKSMDQSWAQTEAESSQTYRPVI